MSVSFHGHGINPEHVEAAFRAAAHEQMDRAMREVESEARRRAPFRTGHLRRSITHLVEVRGHTVVGTVGTNVFYGRYLEQGTGLYGPRNRRIVPVRASALRFPAGGSASTFQGGRRRQGAAGPGFRMTGQQREGSAGSGAEFVFRRSVRGIHPLRFFSDSVEITRGRVRHELSQIPHVAAKRLGRA